MKLSGITGIFKKYFQKEFVTINDKQRKQVVGYVYIVLTLITVSFFGLFAISPTLSTISNLNKQYDDNKLILDGLNKKLLDLASLDEQYKDLKSDIDGAYNAIPQTTKIPKLTRQIEDIASDSDVTLTKLTVGNVEIYPNIKNGNIYSFAFTVSVQGDQITVNNFMASLINFDRIIGIDRVATGQNDEKKYTAQITGRAYFAKK